MSVDRFWFWVEGVGYALALGLGLWLVITHVRGRKLPLTLGLMHGFVATGSTAVLIVLLTGFPHPVIILDDAALFFVLAFLGGLTVLGLQIARVRAPGVLIFLHSLFALFALTLLVIGATRL